MEREQYEKELAERQKKHLEAVNRGAGLLDLSKVAWKPCLHDQCPNCHGTGITLSGGFCFHGLVCDCPKCKVM